MTTDAADIVRQQLAPGGRLRAAINYGNAVLAQRSEAGVLSGVTIDLANEFGRRIGAAVDTIGYPAAGKVVDAGKAGAWDVGFLAIDPLRADSILFTSAYVGIKGSYVVRRASSFASLASVDQPGVRIAVGKDAAYDLFLTRELKQASLVRYPSSADALRGFVEDGLDAGAGVHQPVAAFAATRPDLRLVDEPFMEIRQAVALPKGHTAAHAWIEAVLRDLKTSGFIASALERAGQDPNLVA